MSVIGRVHPGTVVDLVNIHTHVVRVYAGGRYVGMVSGTRDLGWSFQTSRGGHSTGPAYPSQAAAVAVLITDDARGREGQLELFDAPQSTDCGQTP